MAAMGGGRSAYACPPPLLSRCCWDRRCSDIPTLAQRHEDRVVCVRIASDHAVDACNRLCRGVTRSVCEHPRLIAVASRLLENEEVHTRLQAKVRGYGIDAKALHQRANGRDPLSARVYWEDGQTTVLVPLDPKDARRHRDGFANGFEVASIRRPLLDHRCLGGSSVGLRTTGGGQQGDASGGCKYRFHGHPPRTMLSLSKVRNGSETAASLGPESGRSTPLSSRTPRSGDPGRAASTLSGLPEIATRLSGRRVAATPTPDLSPGSPLTQRPGGSVCAR